MAMPEGRAIYQNGTWQNEFAYKDHLGNTRVSFKANGNQLEKVAETAFDPWGVVLNGLGQQNPFQNRFEMQGKESEKTFGLNRINLGARTVNPTTGVFDRVDPLAEASEFYSPYVFAANDPISNIDFLGLTDINADGIDDGQTLPELVVTGKRDNSEGTLNAIQTGLDAAGWIPGVQTAAGLANAGIDVYRGNYGSALINLGSSIPMAGYLFKGAKVAAITTKVVSSMAKMKVAKAALAITYRNMKTIAGMHKHHIIPAKLLTDPGDIGQALRASGFDGQAGDYIRYVEKGFHGNHPEYTKIVAEKLQNIMRENNGNLTIQHINGVVNDMNNIVDKAQGVFKSSGTNLNEFSRQLKNQ